MEVIDRIDEESVRKISKIKGEEKWILDYRLDSFNKFSKLLFLLYYKQKIYLYYSIFNIRY